MTANLASGLFVLFSLYAAGRVFIKIFMDDRLSLYAAIPCGSVLLAVYSLVLMSIKIPFSFHSQICFCSISIFAWVILTGYNIRKLQYTSRNIWKSNKFVWIIIIPVGVVLFYEAGGTPFHGFDEVATYAIKAKILAEHSTILTEEFTDPAFVQDNPGRPLLIPIVMATVFTIADNYAENGAKLFFPAMYLCLLLFFNHVMKRDHGAVESAVSAAFIGMLPCMLMWRTNGASTGYGDIPLGIFLFCALLIYTEYAELKNAWIFAGIFNAGLILTKQEGTILAALLIMGSIFFIKNVSKIEIVKSLVVTILLTIPWWYLRLFITESAPIDYWHCLGNVQIMRLDDILLRMFKECCIYIFLWGMLWYCCIISLFDRNMSMRSNFLNRITVFIVPLYVAVIVYIYVITPQDVSSQMNVTLTRVLQHIAPVVALFVCRNMFVQEKVLHHAQNTEN